MRKIALIAHDACKDALVDWALGHAGALAAWPIVATGTTGQRIAAAFSQAEESRSGPSLALERLKSGPLGGDQQIGALIAEGEIAALIFFIDPLSAMPHDVDVKALTRLAVLYDLPFACNRQTADAVIAWLGPAPAG